MGLPTVVAGRYRLMERLGQGGMGVVWRARDEVLGRDVAVKQIVPPPGLAPPERDELGRRTRREARAAARLSHPNVVGIYDVMDGAEASWIVMEYVPSRSLQQVLHESGPLSPRRVAEIGLEVLGALRCAHRAGVLHRDVKPGNVLLTESGRVVLTDFGQATVPGEAAVTRPGLVIGSPGYISPERARGEPGRPESDLWSLGATLYAAVEGRGPFDRDSAMATLTAVASTDPDPSPHAGPLRPVLDGLLRKDPAARIDATEVERLLRVAANGAGALPDARQPAALATPAGRRYAPGRAVPPARRPPDLTPRHPAPTIGFPQLPPPVHDTSVAPPIPPAPPGPRRRARGPRVVALLALAALALAMFALLPRDTARRDGGASGPTPATTTAAANGTTPPPVGATQPAGPSAGPDAALPAGWRLYRDQTGFAVAVPSNWSMSREGTMVYFREPGGGRVLGIDQTNQPKADPVADWRSQASYRVRRGDFPGYQEIRIEPCVYFLKCADWEFRYSHNGMLTHVNNRGFVVSADKAYGIWWSTAEAQWTESQSYLETVFRTFRPAT